MDVSFNRVLTAPASALALSVAASALVLSFAAPTAGWATPGETAEDTSESSSTDTKSDEELAKEQADEEKSSIDGSGTSSNRANVRSFIDIFGQRTQVFAGDGTAAPAVNGDDQTSALSGGSGSGLAGGDGMQWHQGRLAVWGEASGTIFDDNTPADDLDGYTVTAVMGSDYRFTDSLLGGMALSYEHLGVDFDSGRGRDVNYFGPTVYGAYLLTDTVSISALGSYAYGWNDEKETGGATQTHGSHRFLTSGSLAYNNVYDRITAYGALGILYSAETYESYTNSGGASVDPETNQIGQFNGTSNVGYLFDVGKDAILEPYAAVRMEYDFVSSGNNDRFGTLLGGGMRLSVSDSLSLDAFANTEVARSDESSTDFGLNVRFQF